MRYLMFCLMICVSPYVAAYDIWFNSNERFFLNDVIQEQNKESLKNVNVYKMLSQNVMYSSDRDLRLFFKYLKENNIKLALESPVLVWKKDKGFKLEGFSSQGLMPAVLRKIKSNGGELNFFAMDEAFYFSVLYKGNNSAKYSISQYQEEVVDRLNIVKSIFPDVKIGDIEPYIQIENEKLLVDYFRVIKEISKEVKIDFIHFDVLWQGNWPLTLQKMREFTINNDMKLGVIFNASGEIDNNALWIDTAKSNVEHVIANGTSFEDAVIQGWGNYPDKSFPRKDADSQLSMIDFLHARNY